MIPGETVLSGAGHPGTRLEVLKSAAGWYLGYRDEHGLPYSRESIYFRSQQQAERLLGYLRYA